MRIIAPILAVPLVLLGLSGCLVPESSDYHVFATDGKFALGFAYDGKGIEGYTGGAFIDVDEGSNQGVLVTQGRIAGVEYRIVLEDFAEQAGKAFQDGGIAADFREHGASGVGDRSIPEVDLEMAGWGLATITAGGKPYKDAISSSDKWAAHFMVIRNGVRNDTSGQIHTKEHAVYGPADAAEGLSTKGDYELHLVLKNQTANGSAAAVQIGPFGSSQPNAMLNNRHTFSVPTIGSAVTLDLGVSGTGLTASNVTFRVMTPSGAQLVSRGLGPGTPPAGMGQAAAQIRFTATEVGDYVIQATGRIAPGGAYSVRGTATPPASTVMNFWWESLVFGDEAGQKGDQSGMLEGTKFHGTHGHSGPAASSAPGRKLR